MWTRAGCSRVSCLHPERGPGPEAAECGTDVRSDSAAQGGGGRHAAGVWGERGVARLLGTGSPSAVTLHSPWWLSTWTVATRRSGKRSFCLSFLARLEFGTAGPSCSP